MMNNDSDGACDTGDADSADSDAELRTMMATPTNNDCGADDGEYPDPC